jgi:hypothetical protein
VFLFTSGALALFAVLGTIFGQQTLVDAGVVRKIMLPAVYNTLLAFLVLPLVTWLVGRERSRRGWVL